MSEHLNRIDAAIEEVKLAEEALRVVIMGEQLTCLHPFESIVESESVEDKWGHYHTPPFLVCKDCGYAEEDWHCGPWKLTRYSKCRNKRVPTINREEAWKYVRGSIKNQTLLSKVRFDKEPIESLWR